MVVLGLQQEGEKEEGLVIASVAVERRMAMRGDVVSCVAGEDQQMVIDVGAS